MTANKTRKPIVITSNYKLTNNNSRIKKLILDFLEYLEIEKASSQYTIRNYNFYLTRFYEWINDGNKKNLKKINLDDIRKYRVHLSRLSSRGNRLSKVTQSYHIIALRSWFRWLIKNDIDVISPDRIDLPRAETRKVEFLNKEQVERILNQPSISKILGLRDKAILETLFSTGLRVSELVALNRDQIDLERREFGVVGKGGRTRVVFLSERAASWIERYLKERKDKWIPLFIRFSRRQEDLNSKGEEMRLTVRSIQRIVAKYCKRAKLPIKITPHGLRHSFATDLLQSGAGLREVQEMLGHKNVTTTQIYTHVTNPQLRKVHEKYHSGNK